MSEQKDFAMIGDVRIADNVIAAIAAIAISEIDGAELSPGGGDIRDILKISRPNRGVKIDFSEEGITLDIQIQVRYGLVVADVARSVQDAVVNAVESMTALTVVSVNVSVVGISPEVK